MNFYPHCLRNILRTKVVRKKALYIMFKVFFGLAAIHETGMAHYDIKP